MNYGVFAHNYGQPRGGTSFGPINIDAPGIYTSGSGEGFASLSVVELADDDIVYVYDAHTPEFSASAVIITNAFIGSLDQRPASSCFYNGSICDTASIGRAMNYAVYAHDYGHPRGGSSFGRIDIDVAGVYTSTSGEGFASLTVLASSAVPEPSTWTMMILGIGLVGAMERRCRSSGTRSKALLERRVLS